MILELLDFKIIQNTLFLGRHKYGRPHNFLIDDDDDAGVFILLFFFRIFLFLFII